MKKSIGVVALLIAVTAFADVETSGLFQEYMRRETIEFTKPQKTTDIEIYRESGKFVFQTIDRQMCYGQYIFNTAQFTCFTKAGVLSFFAGGDSD